MKEFRLSNNFYTFVTVACTLGALVYLFNTQPAIAPVFMAAAIPFVVGIVGGMQQSKQNTDKIDKLDTKVETNTLITEHIEAKVAKVGAVANTTHEIVNSRMDEFKKALEDVAAMKEAQSIVLAELNAAKAELAIANERERGIAIGREQAAQTIATNDAARSIESGGTPAHGTPIVPAVKP
jgi:chromosome segregation ATPase